MCARTNDVTESINYKLHFLNRKLITEGIFVICKYKDLVVAWVLSFKEPLF